MGTKQGDPALIHDPVAQELLHSTRVAHLAYIWDDGTPRVVPMWFHWDGEAIVLGSPTRAPKVHVIPNHSKVALTIDSDAWPYKVLLVRGTAKLSLVDEVTPEYTAAAIRYFGEEQGRAWAAGIHAMARIAVTPEWVGILDFEQRFPSALEAAEADA